MQDKTIVGWLHTVSSSVDQTGSSTPSSRIHRLTCDMDEYCSCELESTTAPTLSARWKGMRICEACHGTGFIVDSICRACQATGRVPRE